MALAVTHWLRVTALALLCFASYSGQKGHQCTALSDMHVVFAGLLPLHLFTTHYVYQEDPCLLETAEGNPPEILLIVRMGVMGRAGELQV